MKGTILDFSIQTGEGIISGDDNNRYKFAGSEWKTSDAPACGKRVDFDINEGRGTCIYLELSNPKSVVDSSSTNQVSHTLVWVSAFVPLFSIVIHGMLAGMELPQWIGILIVLGINILLLSKDEKHLKTQGFSTKELGSAWFVPVYLFKRVRVAGGGYGYAVCWMITFFISLLA
jgi:hypothetical protein